MPGWHVLSRPWRHAFAAPVVPNAVTRKELKLHSSHAVALSPQWPMPRYLLGQLYWGQQQLAQAVLAWQPLLQQRAPTSPPWLKPVWRCLRKVVHGTEQVRRSGRANP